MKYSMKEIVESLPKNKSRVSSFWVKLVARRLSFLFTYIFANIGWSANFVSVLSGIDVFAGCVLLCIDNTICRIIGVVLINLWIVLDCCDGNIARLTKKSSYMGEFVDAVSGYVICAFNFLAVGVAAYNRSTLLLGEKSVVWIILGAVACITNLFARLVYQKYTNCVFVTECKVNGSATYTPENYSHYDPNAKKGLTYYRLRIDRQMGISGFFMPALIIATIFDLYDILVCGYALYHVLTLLGVFVVYGKKSIEVEKKMHTDYTV